MDKIQHLKSYIKDLPRTALVTLDAFFQWLKRTFLHPSEGMKTFYLLFIISILCFIYTWVTHEFTVPLGGDYTLQEMTFLFNGYDDWHEFFRTGDFPNWDYSVFLGVDNIGANSFYYLFSPFFLILLIFPRDWLLVLQGLEFVPKLVIAGMLFYWYLGSFKQLSYKTRRIGVLCFAFSGYTFCYLWFHFLDSVAFLPLIFLGIERVIQKKDPRILLVGFLLNAMVSYFFFVVFMIGGFLYAIFRFFQTIKERDHDQNWAVFGLGFFSFLIGIFLSAFVLLPGITTALSMPRVNNGKTWLDGILNADGIFNKLVAVFTYPWSYSQNQITPLVNFLFMPLGCYYSNLLNVSWYDNMQASLYATTPMLLIFFVGLINLLKNKKWWQLFAFAFTLFLLFSPIGFYLFSGFTVGYARYFIIPISWMVVFDCHVLEKRKEIPRTDLDISFIIVIFLSIISMFLVVYEVNNNPSFYPSSTYWDLRLIEVVISIVWMFICYLLLRHFFHKKAFSRTALILASLDIVVMANVSIICQGTVNIDTMAGGPQNIATETEIIKLLKASENDDFYRVYNTTADRGNINISLREGYNGLGAFHSVYPFGTQDFLDRSKIPYTYQNWSMGIHNHRENLETFLSTKYYLVPKVSKPTEPYVIPSQEYDIPYGYKNILDVTEEEQKALNVDYSEELLDYLSSEDCDKSLYVNLNHLNGIFSFDTIINTAWLSTYVDEEGNYTYGRYEDINEYPLLRFAMLDDKDYQTFKEDNKYNADTVVINGVETVMTNTLSTNRNRFYNAIVTSDYEEGNSGAIEYVSGYSDLDIQVYSAQWPATEAVPSGEYAYMNPLDPYDMTGKAEYDQNNPFLACNGIGPADVKYNYDTLTDDDGEHLDTYTRQVLYNSKLVITPKDSFGRPALLCEDADPDDPETGYYISIDSTNNIDWRFFDENGVLISKAQHSFSDYKTAHGYYVDRPVSKIVGIILEGNKEEPCYIDRPNIYLTHNSDYQKAIDVQKQYKATITYRTSDEMHFTTSYESPRFVVLNYPLQDGFTLYEITKDENGEEIRTPIDLYKAQGGFIGFEGKSGECEYVLIYETPHLSLAMAVTTIGILITLICLAYYSYKHKQEHALDAISWHAKQNDSSANE